MCKTHTIEFSHGLESIRGNLPIGILAYTVSNYKNTDMPAVARNWPEVEVVLISILFGGT